MNATPAHDPLDSRRNIFAFIFDIAIFVTGLAFIPSATVLVGLAGQLTEDKSLIGVAGMAFSVTWFLPQLFAARLVRNKPRQKPYILIPSLFGRPMFLLITLWLVFTRAVNPLATLWIMIGGIALFNLCDALAGVAWFDVMSRTLSPRMRARVMVVGQILSGIFGLAASEVVKRVLGNPDIPFPLNYAILFASTFGCMAIATLALLVLRETPMHHAELQEQSQSHFMADLKDAVKHDKLFRRIVVVRLLTGLEAMAASFYLVFLKERYAFGNYVDGEMTQAIIFGGLVGVAFFGWLADRYTSRRVVHASSIMFFVTPFLAALVAALPIPATVAYIIFIGVFLLRGALEHSLVLGVVGYMLDSAPERNRAMYVGAINTLGGIVSLTPFLGGLWIDLFGHTGFNALPYMVLFSVVSAAAAAGMLISLRLPAPRRT
ncbi:MAG: MFS transporter [Chloroflexi bacterium]|nr:MFS transporter [Chloroflexota bacterium]